MDISSLLTSDLLTKFKSADNADGIMSVAKNIGLELTKTVATKLFSKLKCNSNFNLDDLKNFFASEALGGEDTTSKIASGIKGISSLFGKK